MKKIILLSIIYFITTSVVKAVDVASEYAILMDYDTSEILYQKNAHNITAPSSTTKVMTAYVIFNLLEDGKINLNDKFRVSVRAWRQEGTRMFLEPDWKISVDELLKGLIIVSGNDAAITLAEGSAGSVDNFVKIMNSTARQLGMKDTNFTNPNGLYEKNHFMSVYDLALLSQALIKNHPKYYKRYFSQTSYEFNNISQKNRNWLLTEYAGVDGLKTGYTDYGKYSISASVYKNGKRLISVINGASSERERINQAKDLFNYGFSQYKYIELYKSGDIVGEIKVLFGKNNKIQTYTKNDIYYSTKNENINNIKVQFISNKYLQAPIKKDSVIAKLRIIDNNNVVEHELYATEDVDVSTRFKKIKSLFIYNSKKLIGLE